MPAPRAPLSRADRRRAALREAAGWIFGGAVALVFAVAGWLVVEAIRSAAAPWWPL